MSRKEISSERNIDINPRALLDNLKWTWEDYDDFANTYSTEEIPVTDEMMMNLGADNIRYILSLDEQLIILEYRRFLIYLVQEQDLDINCEQIERRFSEWQLSRKKAMMLGTENIVYLFNTSGATEHKKLLISRALSENKTCRQVSMDLMEEYSEEVDYYTDPRFDNEAA